SRCSVGLWDDPRLGRDAKESVQAERRLMESWRSRAKRSGGEKGGRRPCEAGRGTFFSCTFVQEVIDNLTAIYGNWL
ncbi:MAG: hypothetical protein HW385_587, partial [candidate division NC10 bacterium]|nr:hypothetical protein [candidate division NC10 bacterium]